MSQKQDFQAPESPPTPEHESAGDSKSKGGTKPRETAVRDLPVTLPILPPAPAGSLILIKRHSGWMLTGGLTLFLINVVAAWVVVFLSQSSLREPITGMDRAQGESITPLLERGKDAKENEYFLLHRALAAIVYHRLMVDRQTVVIVSMSLAFGLMAVGFCLYVLGVESASAFQGQQGGGDIDKDTAFKVALTAQSPGVICFFLATVLAIFGITRPAQMSLGEFTVYREDKPASATAESKIKPSNIDEIPEEEPPGASKPAPATKPKDENK